MRAAIIREPVESSGICGTDMHIFDGDYMGDYPIIPGHEFSGTVVEIGGRVNRIKVGDLEWLLSPILPVITVPPVWRIGQNFCENWIAVGVLRQGGMAEYVTVPEKAVFNVGNLDFDTAALMEPLSCVIHGAERS